MTALLERFGILAFGVVAVAGCPAPPIDDTTFDYDVSPFDAHATDPIPMRPAAPTCTPEATVDMNALGTRDGATLRLQVDTRRGRNDIRIACVLTDSRELMLRYTTPSFATRNVKAVRVTTVTAATISNASLNEEHPDFVPDPTGFDTVLAIRDRCDGRDLGCNNDAFIRDATGQRRNTRRSTVYFVGTTPEQPLFIMLDGYDGQAGFAEVSVEEITELGRAGAPCMPIPPERAQDPTARTADFRCPHPGIRCGPGAAPDGTDLCLPVLRLGERCDFEGRFNLCERTADASECVSNPSAQDEVLCALPGTAAGARCRGLPGSANRCDANLACSPGVTPTDREDCVPIRNRGDSCDPAARGYINYCATGLVCCAQSPDAGTNTTCQPVGTTCYPTRP